MSRNAKNLLTKWIVKGNRSPRRIHLLKEKFGNGEYGEKQDVSDTHGSQRMRTRGWQGDRDGMHRAGAEAGVETPSAATRSEGNTAGGDFNGRTAGGASS